MADDPSNWHEATQLTHPMCPYCGTDRDIERSGAFWHCPVCTKEWYAWNRSDRRLLRVAKISPD